MNTKVDLQKPLVTLVGPPNSGKTTLFNFLSGKNLKTVNYPGSTVEYSTSSIMEKYNINGDILDSPGIISLQPNSPDEQVSIDSLFDHPHLGSPHLVIATADASQLSRHLLLTKQLINAGFKVILAVTMSDVLLRKDYKINDDLLSEKIGCEVVSVNGRTGEGIDELVDKIKRNLKDIEQNGKPDPKRELIDPDKISLLEIYREIEDVEEEVLEPVFNNNGKLNLKAANRELNIINPELKRGNYRPDEITLKIDRILLHRYWGLISFFLIMAVTFTSIFWIADPFMRLVDELFSTLASYSSDLLGNTWFGSLVSDGIISGTGSVLVFLPQIIILFLILGLLEDTGYLARGAMLIDKPLSKIGLNGRSFVPMLSGFACAIPAMLATRTISNRKERLLTIFIIPLMSCSARLPVYALLIVFLTPGDKPWMGGLILAAIYIFSIVSSLFAAAIVNKFRNRLIREEDTSSFILELPSYKLPKIPIVIRNSIESAKQYIYRAGPIILVLSIVLWFLMYFPNTSPEIDSTGMNDEEISQVEESVRLETSYAADLGKIIQPVMTPIGMDWRIGVSLIASIAAREVFVSSLALIFKVTDTGESIESSLLTAMDNAKNEATGKKLFTTSTIMGLIIFFVFALQCISTLAVSRKETGSWRIPILQLILFTSLAYILTLITVNGMKALGFS